MENSTKTTKLLKTHSRVEFLHYFSTLKDCFLSCKIFVLYSVIIIASTLIIIEHGATILSLKEILHKVFQEEISTV